MFPMALSSLTLALTSRMFSSVSWVLACSASSAACIRLCLRFMGSRKATITTEPTRAARIITGTKRQSQLIRITAAPINDTAVVSSVGSRFIIPPLTTDTSEKTRLTSSPLW